MRALALPTLLIVAAVGHAGDPDGVAFFEGKIRPVLVEHCLKCHSAEAERNGKLKGGLLLDTRDGLLKGGDSGPAVVPGKPADSLLLKALKYAGDVQMPPKGKLPAAVIADFETWLKMGAPDPRTGTAAKRQVGMSVEAGRAFWAYKRPQTSPLPEVKDAAWPRDPIDRWILARLEANGRRPAPDAERLVLARRLFFDLTGLPPTPDEADAFLNDLRPDAYERLVDRLLASPGFGERWGRHWLDIARFAESVTLRGFVFKEAWRYRDYVIDSFNSDVPFARFVREQIAGDLLPAANAATRSRQLVATTYLTLGNTNLEEQDKKQLRMDVVDEQLDVLAKGFLAQTVTCARCHDHKFDPIPTRDYYALAGILRNAKAMEHANVSQWLEVPLPLPEAEEAVVRRHEEAVAALQARLKGVKGSATSATGKGGALRVADVPGVVVDDAAAAKVGDWQHSQATGTYIGSGYLHDKNEGKGQKTLTFQPENLPPGRYEVRLAYSSGGSRAVAVPVTVFSADGEKTVPVDMKKSPPVDGRYVSLGEYRFEKNGLCYVLISNEGTTGHVTADAVVFLPLDKAEASGKADAAKALEAELKRLQDAGPKRPKTMSVVEEKAIEDVRVHLRGSVHTLGEVAPRGFLQVATTGPPPQLPKDQSGRLQLADWVASADNPLTARVFVNRAWHWLFGSGLVRTTDNFGTTGERPSHPELLDHLALSFVADGGSVKRLVRRLVLSRTYRQSTDGASGDPENRLFGRANRRRLEAECLRDAMMQASGRLTRVGGGPTFPASLTADYGYKGESNRRSVYLPQFRNAVPEILEVFDAADPSTVVGRRNASAVAPQALYLLNHPFPAEQARLAAVTLLAETSDDEEKRLSRAYRWVLGREPTAGERRAAAPFLRDGDPTAAWATLFHALFACADFRYVN